jgi:hypothetical protein
MSKEQLTEKQPGQDAATPTTEGQDQTYGLRPDLVAQIMQMSPADADKLASLLVLYPSFIGRILPVASHHLGNSAVQRAIALAKAQHSTNPQGGSMNQDEIHESLGSPTDSSAVKSGEVAPFIEDKSEPQAPEEEPDQPKQVAAPDPAWASARQYNDAHPDLVAEFDDLTDGVCQDDDTTKLDPKAVASWQRHHGVDDDGKVGPRTVAAARAVKAKGPEVAQTLPQTDARPPV